jgi:photosystem II stability/assembly factor-like uncharacterized protein
MTRLRPFAAPAVALSLLVGCGGAGAAANAWYAVWWCTSAQCAAVMGGSGGIEGPFGSVDACNAWRTTYITTSVCTQDPGGTSRPPPPPPPTISGFTPSGGVGPVPVTITGTNFTADSIVTFNGRQQTLTNFSATTLQFTVPLMGSFTGPFKVTTSGGTVTSSGTYQSLSDLRGIAWSGSRFVAVGSGDDILTSPDGITWTARASNIPKPSSNILALMGVAATPSRMVAVGYGGQVAVSTDDGTTWTGSENELLGNLYGVTGTGTQFVAVGTKFQTSPDGLAWTNRTTPLYAYSNDVAWTGSLLVATGNDSSKGIVTSPDGITWTVPSSVTPYSMGNHGVAVSPGLIVVVGQGSANSVITSPDGVTWTPRAGPLSPVGVTWSAALSRFIAVGLSGAISTTPDAVTWTGRSSGTSVSLSRVACSPSLCVAVGNAGTILTSPDGVTWTKRATP